MSHVICYHRIHFYYMYLLFRVSEQDKSNILSETSAKWFSSSCQLSSSKPRVCVKDGFSFFVIVIYNFLAHWYFFDGKKDDKRFSVMGDNFHCNVRWLWWMIHQTSIRPIFFSCINRHSPWIVLEEENVTSFSPSFIFLLPASQYVSLELDLMKYSSFVTRPYTVLITVLILNLCIIQNTQFIYSFNQILPI